MHPELGATSSMLQGEYLSFIHSENTIVLGIRYSLELKDLLDVRLEHILGLLQTFRRKMEHVAGVLLLRQARMARAYKKNKEIAVNDNFIPSLFETVYTQHIGDQVKSDFAIYVARTIELKQSKRMSYAYNLQYNVLPQAAAKVTHQLNNITDSIDGKDPVIS